jgi:transcriptional regulator
MYVPKHFEETRVEVLHALIRRHPLGTLVAVTPQGLDASHIPFEIDPDPAPYGTLRGHVAKANPLWQSLAAAPETLVVFQGSDAYVSPSWYVAKQEHGKVVPTWNYAVAVVHAHGTARVVHDAAWLRTLVTALTDHHEEDRADRWRVTDAPAEYVEKMLAAIVGIEIPIARLQGKWKLSQNRSPADRRGVGAGLESEGRSADTVAALIREKL